MDLLDHAGFPVRLYRGVIDEQRLFASLVVKTVWSVVDGALRLEPVQDWAVLDGPKPTPEGVLPTDQYFHKAGADLFVLGAARSAKPVARQRVEVRIGTTFNVQIEAIGRRVWRKRLLRAPEASEPQPFTELPLTVAQSFGGSDLWDELPIPFPDNPTGTGYYISAESAIDRPLPGIEDPAAPIRKWDDRPEPVGIGLRPPAFGPHLRQAVEFGKDGHLTKLDPLFFNAAFPRCVVRTAKAGDAVTVRGMRVAGDWTFALPNCPVRAEASIGGRVTPLALQYDQLWFEPDSGRVRIAWRSPFRYTLVPLERRSVRLERVA
jgi:hypothetical protein